MTWSVETLDHRVDSELSALPADIRAKFVRISNLIEEVGLPALGMPHIRHLEGPIWELRMKGREGIARGLYVTADKRRVVVLRVFVKKTQKTPKKELEIARKRHKEMDA